MLNELDDVKEKYLKLGNDLSKPLYKISKGKKNVTDLEVVDINKEEFGMIGSLLNAKSGGEMYLIRCKILSV